MTHKPNPGLYVLLIGDSEPEYIEITETGAGEPPDDVWFWIEGPGFVILFRFTQDGGTRILAFIDGGALVEWLSHPSGARSEREGSFGRA